MMTCVAEPASFIETLLTVAAYAEQATVRRAAVSAAMRPPQRPVRAKLVSSRILVTLFGLQADRQRLGFAEGVLHHLQLALADPRDVPVHDRVSNAKYITASAAVFHQRELIRGTPHDAHEVDVPHVDEGAVHRLGLKSPIEQRLKRIAPAAADVLVALAREENARVHGL